MQSNIYYKVIFINNSCPKLSLAEHTLLFNGLVHFPTLSPIQMKQFIWLGKVASVCTVSVGFCLLFWP